MAKDEESLTIAAAGDAILTRRLSKCENERLRKTIEFIQNCDTGFVNLEILLHDLEGYPAYHGLPGKAGTWMRAPPYVADELQMIGFDLMSVATNHVMDYTHGGMEATMRELEKRGITYAGLGRNLVEARSPSYVDTKSGRVGLVAACSSFVAGSPAGMPLPGVPGRPGVSPLRVEGRYKLPEDEYERIKRIGSKLGIDNIERGLGFNLDDRRGFDVDTNELYSFLNVNPPFCGGETTIMFEKSDEYRIERVMNEEDRGNIINQVEQASKQSDWVIASLHAHEGCSGAENDTTIPSFLETFARDCIDAGADMFIGHGPHVLRGIEIYSGAPLFYSLGNFIFQNQTLNKIPSDMYESLNVPLSEPPEAVFDKREFTEDGDKSGMYADRKMWESILPICEFSDGGLQEIKLYPLDLQMDQSRSRRGRPFIAESKLGKRIIDDLQELSKEYGTKIAYEDGVGVISM